MSLNRTRSLVIGLLNGSLLGRRSRKIVMTINKKILRGISRPMLLGVLPFLTLLFDTGRCVGPLCYRKSSLDVFV